MNSPKPPPPPPPAPTQEDPAVKQAAENVRLAAQRAGGRQSTILTSGLGDVTTAPTYGKTLLGS